MIRSEDDWQWTELMLNDIKRTVGSIEAKLATIKETTSDASQKLEKLRSDLKFSFFLLAGWLSAVLVVLVIGLGKVSFLALG